VLCNQVFNRSVSPEDCFRRGVDLFQVVINVADLVLTNAPKNFSLNICRESNGVRFRVCALLPSRTPYRVERLLVA
jgi:hypothetical protein